MSPQILLVLILLTLIIISAAYLNQTASFKKEVASSSISPSFSPTPTVTPFTTLSPSPTVTPNLEPANSASGNSNIQGISGSGTINLQYPNSSLIKDEQRELTFISFDDPQVVTNWYKDQIKKKGMNVTSFVQTQTNGEVLNKLIGSNGQQKVEVEITKENNQKEVKIKLHVNS